MVVTKVDKKPMPIVIDAVGTVQAIASIQIKSRVDSQIMKVNVEEGALVKEGDILFELDARTLKAQLGQIEAQIRKDQAQVAQAKRDVSRYEELLSKNAGTVVNRDTAQTTLKAAEAQLEADEAARASVQTQITYTQIRAPVSGRIGSISSKAGTVIRVGDNSAASALATINQVDPIYVAFAVPQVFLPEIRSAMADSSKAGTWFASATTARRARCHDQPGRSDLCRLRRPQVFLPDIRAAMAKGDVKVVALIDENRKQSGAIAFLENNVDPLTGTVTAKARIGNANEGLWPGQFVKAEIILGIEPEAISVPAPAIQLGPQGPYLFVIKDGIAELRPVEIKRTQNGESVIGKGLQPGEQVVVDGQLRLVNGANVTIRPATPETPSTASAPPRG